MWIDDGIKSLVIVAYENGTPVKAIAERFGISQMSVFRSITPDRAKRKLDVDIVNEIITAYRHGDLVADIAQRFNVHESTIRRIVPKEYRRTCGQHATHGIDDAVRMSVVDAYRHGEPLRTIAKRFGISHGSITKHVPVAERRKKVVSDRSLSKHEKASIIDAHNVGMTISDIASTFGCSHNNIIKVLRESGINPGNSSTMMDAIRVAVVDAYVGNVSITRIMQEHHITAKQLLVALAESLETINERLDMATDKTTECRIIADYSHGHKVKYIQERYHVTRGTIMAIVRRNLMDVRTRAKVADNGHLFALLQSLGHSREHIAKLFHVSVSSIAHAPKNKVSLSHK